MFSTLPVQYSSASEAHFFTGKIHTKKCESPFPYKSKKMCQCSFVYYQATLPDFIRFISKPENVENTAKRLSVFCISCSSFKNNVTSSAYSAVFIFSKRPFPAFQQCNPFMFTQCFISAASSSLARTNASGEKGQPLRIPSSTANTREKINLSIAGKVCIIATFLISHFTYIIQARVVPDSVLTQANRLLFRFLRRKKECNPKTFEKVKRTVVCGALENGGLYIIDLKQMQTSFLLQWVGRLFQAQALGKWSDIPKNMLLHLETNTCVSFRI